MPVTHVVNMHDAKTKLSHLVAQAREGDDVIIARAGKPVAKLIPFDGPAHPQRFWRPGGSCSRPQRRGMGPKRTQRLPGCGICETTQRSLTRHPCLAVGPRGKYPPGHQGGGSAGICCPGLLFARVAGRNRSQGGAGKLPAISNLLPQLEECGFRSLPLDGESALGISRFPGLERHDPFDRLLVSQALAHSLFLKLQIGDCESSPSLDFATPPASGREGPKRCSRLANRGTHHWNRRSPQRGKVHSF